MADRRVYHQRAARPSAIPAVTKAVFSSSWAVACFYCCLLRREQQQHRLHGRSPMNSPGWWSDFPGTSCCRDDWFRLVYPWVVADSRVRPSYDLRCYSPGCFPDGIPCRSVTGRAQFHTQSPGGLMHTGAFSDSVRCSPGCRQAMQWHLRRWPGTAFERRTLSRL